MDVYAFDWEEWTDLALELNGAPHDLFPAVSVQIAA